jgi:predicted amidohydrolase
MGDHAAWMREAVAQARRLAEPLDGQAVKTLSGIAVLKKIHLSAGLLEDAGNLLYNTQVLAAPDGRVWHWRKLHVPIFETPFYNGGDGLDVAETALGRVGANICFDALMPESTRLLAVQNVEVALFPFAADPAPGTAAAWAEWAGTALRSRCQENGVFGVACNYAGEVEFAGVRQSCPGGSMIVGPSGEVLAQRGGEGFDSGMLLADLKVETLVAARAAPEYLFRFRRPELYGPLA